MTEVQTPKKRAPGGGRKKFRPDDKQRLVVSIMAACGMPQPEIAKQIINPDTGLPLSDRTLRGAFSNELENGKAKANAMVAQTLFRRATDAKGGSSAVIAAIFWLKTQARWKEPHHIELTGKDGGPIQSQRTPLDLSKLTDEELDALERIVAKTGGDTSGAD